MLGKITYRLIKFWMLVINLLISKSVHLNVINHIERNKMTNNTDILSFSFIEAGKKRSCDHLLFVYFHIIDKMLTSVGQSAAICVIWEYNQGKWQKGINNTLMNGVRLYYSRRLLFRFSILDLSKLQNLCQQKANNKLDDSFQFPFISKFVIL